MSKTDKLLSSESWQASVRVVEDFIKTDHKLDSLFNWHASRFGGDISRRIQYLSYGVVRNLGRLQSVLKSAVRRAPKKRLQAILLTAMFEWSEASEESRPQVVHFAVEQAKQCLSKPEGRFVNAVLRRISDLEFKDPIVGDSPDSLSVYYSHPKWLVTKWIQQFGANETKEFLEWNQSRPKVYAWSSASASELPVDWLATDWSEFYEIQNADWQTTRICLAEGKAYIQDPSTRLGPSLLDGLGVKTVLDLCAAPGGKSIQLQQRIPGPDGLLVSVDLPGPRFERLKENLARYSRPVVKQMQFSRNVLDLTTDNLPLDEFDAVYVDVPCSNTGVLQRRPDVKWRQSEESLEGLLELQLRLLGKAAEFVAPAGYLIYSTCSVDVAENEKMVDRFLQERDSSFTIEKAIQSFPWESGHDGAGACLLRKAR